jgi:CRP/FNR family transcriptional regulator, cyclic AMP receptor protein
VHFRNRSQKVELLKSIPIFSYLTKQQLTEVAKHADEVQVDAGHVLASEGARGHEMFVIASGGVEVTKAGRTIATLGSGDVVGELSLLDGKPRTADVVATEPSTLLVVAGREFEPLLHDIPELSVRLLKALAQRLREADEALAH